MPQEFFDALDREDDLGMVVRAHIVIESMRLELVSLRLKRPDELGRRVGFEQRVRLALALGDLDPEQAPALRALNTLRNDFTHDVSTRLSTERADAIWGALRQRERAVVESIYRGA